MENKLLWISLVLVVLIGSSISLFVYLDKDVDRNCLKYNVYLTCYEDLGMESCGISDLSIGEYCCHNDDSGFLNYFPLTEAMYEDCTDISKALEEFYEGQVQSLQLN